MFPFFISTLTKFTCQTIAVRISTTVIEYHDQKKREGKGFTKSYTFISMNAIEGCQGQNLRRKPEGRNWSWTHGNVLSIDLLLLLGLAYFLKQIRATCPGTTTHVNSTYKHITMQLQPFISHLPWDGTLLLTSHYKMPHLLKVLRSLKIQIP